MNYYTIKKDLRITRKSFKITQKNTNEIFISQENTY